MISLLKACTIIVATSSPNPAEIVKHEMAHCWGWVHPEREASNDRNYRSFEIPARYARKGEYPNATVYFVTMPEAKKQCDGHWGCMWFD